MEFLLTFGLIATIITANDGQIISEYEVELENEAGILEQVETILSDFSKIHIGTVMSSTSNFLLATGVKIFSMIDPKIVSRLVSFQFFIDKCI